MADIIDAFVVSLGIDATQYQREIKKFRDDRKRLDQESAKSNRDQEDAQKRLTQGMRDLRNETAGFLFMVAGATGVKDFVQSMITGDAATGRLAANLGVATANLSAWQEAVKQVGGSAEDANQAMQALVTLKTNYALGRASPDQLAGMQGLGVSKFSDPDTMLLELSKASQRMTKPQFVARASMLGINANMINLLEKGPAEVEKTLEQMRKIGVATDADAEAAQKFNAALNTLGSTIRAIARPAVEGLADEVGKWASNQDNINMAMDVGISAIAAIGVAAAAASWEIILIAGAIFAVMEAYKKLKAIGDESKRNATTRDVQGNSVQRGHYVGDVGAKGGVITHNSDGSSSMEWKDRPLHWVGTSKGQGHWEGVGSGVQNASGVGPGKGTKVDPWFMPAPAGSGSDGGSGSTRGSLADSLESGSIRSGAGNADYIKRYWIARGLTPAEADGVVRAMKAENGSLDPSKRNSAGGGQGAYGLGQLRGARQAALLAKYGPNPTLQQQLDFMYSEMVHGDAGGGAASWGAIHGSNSRIAAASAMIRQYYRPGVGTAGDMRRAGVLGGGGGGNVSIGQIVINAPGADAKGIARDIRSELSKRATVAQANYGLQQ